MLCVYNNSVKLRIVMQKLAVMKMYSVPIGF